MIAWSSSFIIFFEGISPRVKSIFVAYISFYELKSFVELLNLDFKLQCWVYNPQGDFMNNDQTTTTTDKSVKHQDAQRQSDSSPEKMKLDREAKGETVKENSDAKPKFSTEKSDSKSSSKSQAV